ncbi:MAG: Crp/Fnr family transcriptional regulator [Candidatus Kapabacteria bacterium]|nr:Crp/Fnr family transcriptional regulator [Candidatus Kapabacteria bacterium]MBX7153552.1 Crp/Fnr family transcriptional regulator [Bacteroidota bacterium]
MERSPELNDVLALVNPALATQILECAKIVDVPENTELLHEGQYVSVIPLVVKGLIKVYSQYDGKELLLYYIKPNESCIMSFAAALQREPSKIFAVTEEDSTIILLPVEKVVGWTAQFPDINTLFFKQYNQRYSELLTTIHHLLFSTLDVRLYDYLKNKSDAVKKNPLKISHRQIAAELGTAREVITRVLKKLENEQKIRQHQNSIEIF